MIISPGQPETVIVPREGPHAQAALPGAGGEGMKEAHTRPFRRSLKLERKEDEGQSYNLG